MCPKAPRQRVQLLRREADVLCLIGWKLAVSGAETRLVMQVIERICSHLRLNPPEVILTRSIIWLEVSKGPFSACAQRKIQNFGINMSNVSEISLLCNSFLKGRMSGLGELKEKVEAVSSFRYNCAALCFIEAVAGLCFAYLNGGDLKVCLAALIGGLVLMAVRFCLVRQGFLAAFAFIAAAFMGCTTTMLVSRYAIRCDEAEMRLAIMATTLLLVPGYPYMNGFLDVFKGYLETGAFRLMHSIVLTMAAAIGLLGAFWFMGAI
ncbi:MAG: threonine/serine exporter family protein [Succinivibrio sp.]